MTSVPTTALMKDRPIPRMLSEIGQKLCIGNLPVCAESLILMLIIFPYWMHSKSKATRATEDKLQLKVSGVYRLVFQLL